MVQIQPERLMYGDYPVVGGYIDPSVVNIRPDSITTLYNFVSKQLLPDMASALPDKPGLAGVNEVPGVVAVGDYFSANPGNAHDYQRAMYTGMLLSHQDAESWRLRVIDTRYRYAKINYKISSHYSVDVIGGSIAKARRDVYFIFQETSDPENNASQAIIPYGDRSLKEEKFALFDRICDAFSKEDETIARVMYGRPMNQADCHLLHERLQRLSKRCLASAC
jgi:hypothetical protein